MANFTLYTASPLLRMMTWSKTASTAYAVGDLVTADNDGSGVGFDKANATSVYHIGIVQETVASTDSDYASTTRENLLVDPFGEYLAVVGTGTADANDEGNIVDLKSDGTVDVTASSVDVFLVRKFIAGTLVQGFIKKWAYFE